MTQIEFDLVVLAISAGAGFIGALIGLGGGMILVPVLVIFMGIDIRYAMGAALASVIATSSGAAAAYLRDGVSNMKIGLFLCVATTLGAVGGAGLATILPAQALSLVFGVVLLVSVLLSLKKQEDEDTSGMEPTKLGRFFDLDGSYPHAGRTFSYHVRQVPGGFLMMIVAGVLSGLLGIGSGAFKVLAMDRIMRIPFQVSTATSNFMIGVTAAASIGIYLQRGYLDPVLIFPVALGVLAGAFLGARLLALCSTLILRWIFLVAITAIGGQMILKGMGVAL